MINLADKHNQSFFGQSTGLTIQSSSKNEPYLFITCIKKKLDENWEKPSKGEGKTIKCSLEELVMILKVLKRKLNSWSGYHTYNDNNTQISFSWEKNKEDKLWINIGDYSKMLGIAQIEIFRLLLKHLIKEKIEHATVSNISYKNNLDYENQKDSNSSDINKIKIDENIITQTNISNDINIEVDKTEIIGSIKAETDKALLISFKSGQELWFPKSTIHSNYKTEIGISQIFLTDKWIIEKNKIKI